jgi:Bacterial SH3 domain
MDAVPRYPKLLALSTTLVLALIGAMGSVQAEERCAVADPTGTPLNVRLTPNGKIIGTLPNGLTVRIQQTSSDHGNIWARIIRDRDNAMVGWVFRNYLDCNASVT